MKFIVEITNLDNAAFREEYGGPNQREYEVVRILRKIADEVEDLRTDGPCMDINGTSVGSWGFREGK